MLEYYTEPGESVFIRCQLGSTDTGLFPQTKIYSIDNPTTVYTTLNLNELSNGLYGIEWTTPNSKGKYFTQTIVYTDSNYTNIAGIVSPDSDSINVGRYQGGGYIGGDLGSRTKAVRTELTQEEIEKISEFIISKIEPKLSKIESIAEEVKNQKIDILNEMTDKIQRLDNSNSFSDNTLHLDMLEKKVIDSLKEIKDDNDLKLQAVGSLIDSVGIELSEKVKKPIKIKKEVKIIEKVLDNSEFYNLLSIGDFIGAFKILKRMSMKEKEKMLNLLIANPYYKSKFSKIAQLDELMSIAKSKKSAIEKNFIIDKMIKLGFTQEELKYYAK